MKKALAVFKKEWRDMLRDRRAMLTIFSYPLLGPAMILVMLTLFAGLEERRDNPTLAVAGADQAPVLIEYLERNDVDIRRVEITEAPTEVPEGSNALLIIDPDFKAKMQAGLQVELVIYGDMSKKRDAITISAVRRSMRVFSATVLETRLIARGISPDIANPVDLDVADLSGSGQIGRSIVLLIVMFFVLNPFVTGISLAVDMTAGERERHSLQCLLAQPVSSLHIAIGKWFVISLFSLISVSLAVLLQGVALSFAPLGQLSISLDLSVSTLGSVLLILLPLCLFVPAIQLWAAMFARSFKEGQMYLSLLLAAPTAVAVLSNFSDDQVEGGMTLFPIFNEINLIPEVLLTGDIDYSQLLLPASISLLFTIFAVWMTGRKLAQESLLDS